MPNLDSHGCKHSDEVNPEQRDKRVISETAPRQTPRGSETNESVPRRAPRDSETNESVPRHSRDKLSIVFPCSCRGERSSGGFFRVGGLIAQNFDVSFEWHACTSPQI